MKQYFSNILIYSILAIAIILCFTYIVCPFVTMELQKLDLANIWINVINSVITIVAMLPFIMGFIMAERRKKDLVNSLTANENKVNRRRLTILSLLRVFLAVFLITLVLFVHFKDSHTVFPVIFITLSFVVFLIFARKKFTMHWRIEDRFLENLNQKEELERQKSPLRSSINAQMSNRDVHLAEITVSPDSPFVGKSLQELDLRKNYNVNIAKIIRGHKMIYFPGANDCVYPSDQLVAIGTDEHITAFTKVMEMQIDDITNSEEKEIQLTSFVVCKHSPIRNKTLAESGLRSAGCLVIEVDRGDESHINPDMQFSFNEGDLVWIAGTNEDVKQFIVAIC